MLNAFSRRRLLFGACLALLALVPVVARPAPVPLGPVTAATALPDGAALELGGGGRARLSFLAHGIVRVEVTPPGVSSLPTGAVIMNEPAAGAAELFQDAATVVVRQGGLSVIVVKDPLQMVVLRADGSVITADLPGGAQYDAAAGTVVVLKHARPGERFFGMGLNGGPLDRRGRSLIMRNADRASYGEFTNPLYSSTPFFYGYTGGATYGLYVDSPMISQFAFDVQGNEVLSIAAAGGTLNYYLMAGPTPADVAKSFKELTGATPLPPRWALGYLQAHFGYASADEVLGLAREFRDRQIPCDAFFLDLDYTDRLFSLTWNPLTWPDPVGFNAEMEGLGFKRVNILEPLLTVYDPLWAVVAANGWFVKGPTGDPLLTNIWLGDVSFIDFTNPGARGYFKGVLKDFVATGVSGLWADLNEPAANEMPYAVFDFEGRPRYEYGSRNVYALWETATLHDALLEARPGERSFIVSRSGFAGIQRYAANWSGDTESTWDSLRVQVQVANSMGLSGQNLFGADIGGFLGAPDAELFLRWLQFGSATPFMRNHSMNTSPPREPWRFGEPYTSAARAIIEWRYRIMPYLYGLFAQAESSGAPVLAPTFFHFPGDALTHAASGEFMLGPALLVAPVVEPGATTRSLHLPAGARWVDYYTDTVHDGGRNLTVDAPVHQMPILARAGSIVPMGPVRQYAAQAAAAEYLVLDIFAGANGRFVMRGDDGATTAYRSGDFLDTALEWTESPVGARFTASPLAGSRSPAVVPWWLQVRAWGATPPTRVVANGVILARAPDAASLDAAGGWVHEASTGRVIVRLPARTDARDVMIER